MPTLANRRALRPPARPHSPHPLQFQGEFQALSQQLAASKDQVLEARKELALSKSGGGAAAAAAAAAGDDDEGGRAVLLRKSKAEFAPRSAESASGTAAKALLKKKSSKATNAAF